MQEVRTKPVTAAQRTVPSGRLRMGMVGGGAGAFIGDLHRKSAVLDGEVQLVCGAFSSDPAKCAQTGRACFLDASRVYPAWLQMIEAEAALPESDRMELVSIVTPNDLHTPVASAALKAGFHVICDKPVARNLAEALKLEQVVESADGLFAVTCTYLGYPMVKEARRRVAAGEIGEVRKVYVEFLQGWLSSRIEQTGHKQASWRTDPERSGPSGCMADIGTHAETLVTYMLGERISSVCALLARTIEGRPLDDDGDVLFRTESGVRGVLSASQICSGEENDLTIRIYGDGGGLEWRHSDPNTLWQKASGRPAMRLRAGNDQEYLSESARMHCRTPAGHPEGYLEAFANIYRNFARAIEAHRTGQAPDPLLDYPGIEQGVSSLAFVDAVLNSHASGHAWTAIDNGGASQ